MSSPVDARRPTAPDPDRIGEKPDAAGRFGAYGGRYAPEALMAALTELEAAYRRARADATFGAELATLLRDRVGRPTRLHRVPGFERVLGVPGVRVYLKREDMAHTGAYKINNALGQGLLAKRMGKTRVIAETGAGQHGVAVASVRAMLGLSCVVYMGEHDMRRQSLTVAHMRALGAEVRGVRAGGGKVKGAVSEAVRDWVSATDTSHFLFGTVTGPAPYPAMVRDFQAVIGVEARRQLLAAEGRLPDRVVACVGGGSNALGLFHAFLGDPEVALIGVEAAGRGIETGQHAATCTAGAPGELDGSFSYLLQDADGQVSRTHSIAAGLDYPAVGPEHGYLKDRGRAVYHAVTDATALRGFQALSHAEGIVPALESAHAVGYLMECAQRGELPPRALVLLGLSGRGDKDLGIASVSLHEA
ncbi:tryptophan synthase subunit beta [Nocardia sp. alder85J]|uniref:tryptophan synthase subunit beta n=1 Tax=Nocardia sp. alder85J TaxID=2862949 RepID=UPI001CD805AE|nr:tryptophan synthase subunit beta [Nocardia sp. alder85J]MCX4099043.1 tryptophan synthase subunit beta [Nocardia sp. alder85J]